MKIGKLSALSGVPKDTIRYYIKIGLLLPKLQGSLLDFTQRDIDDLEIIKKLKTMGFSLKEIQHVFSLRFFSNWVEPEIINEYIYLLQKKQSQLTLEIKSKQKSHQIISEEINKLTDINQGKRNKLGVPLMALQYLACPNCGTTLDIEQAKMNYKYINSGELSCICGYKARIENGIVLTQNLYIGEYDKPDLKRELYRNLNEEFSIHFRTCSDLLINKLRNLSIQPKVALEANINGCFYLYNHLKELKTDCLYIFIDKFPETLFMYKELIELLGLELNILFIADASTSYPIKHHCVDLLISFFGENEHMLYHENTFLRDTQKYYTPDFYILGAFMAYTQHARSKRLIQKKYPECSSQTHSFEYLHGIYSSIPNKTFEFKYIGDVLKSSDNYAFSCHVPGETLKIYYFSLC